jgi:hypothetical protein
MDIDTMMLSRKLLGDQSFSPLLNLKAGKKFVIVCYIHDLRDFRSLGSVTKTLSNLRNESQNKTIV